MHCVLFSLWIAALTVVGIAGWALGSKANGGPRGWRIVAYACTSLWIASIALRLVL